MTAADERAKALTEWFHRELDVDSETCSRMIPAIELAIKNAVSEALEPA